MRNFLFSVSGNVLTFTVSGSGFKSNARIHDPMQRTGYEDRGDERQRGQPKVSNHSNPFPQLEWNSWPLGSGIVMILLFPGYARVDEARDTGR